MSDLRDLECLVALARHRHFARAAADCGLSQPAFSMRIRNLEERLDTTIVKRGNRFQGLTVEGEAVTAHAREILERVRAMEQEVRATRGAVSGTLTLGAVPTATAYAGHVAVQLLERHPGIRMRIESTTSLTIQQGLIEGTFDAGITYSEGIVADTFRVEPLYCERYALLAPPGFMQPGAEAITWAEAALLPLALLEPGMQNRRIINRVFEERAAEPRVVAESNGFTPAVAMVRAGTAATIVPQALVETLGPLRGIVVLALIEPTVTRDMSFVTLTRPRSLPVVEALRSVLIAG